MSSEPDRVFLFGDFRLETTKPRLQRSSDVVTLTPKATHLLVLLVEKAGSLVTKEELISALWPDVVVQEGNLVQQISLLRKQLGAEWIETVPKVGYRFVGEVRREDISESPGVSEPARKRTAITAVVVVAVLAMTVIAIALFDRHSTGASRIRSVAVLPFRPIGPQQDIGSLGEEIADAVVTRLSAVPSLDVRPSSVLRKSEGGKSELGVDAIVEGTIQREQDRLRIRVQVVDLRRGVPIYSGKFDEKATDLEAIANLVSGAVARALGV